MSQSRARYAGLVANNPSSHPSGCGLFLCPHTSKNLRCPLLWTYSDPNPTPKRKSKRFLAPMMPNIFAHTQGKIYYGHTPILTFFEKTLDTHLQYCKPTQMGMHGIDLISVRDGGSIPPISTKPITNNQIYKMNITNQNAYAILQELEHQAKDSEILQQEITSAMQVVEKTLPLFRDSDPDVCDVVWTTEDVISHAKLGMDKPVTVEQAREVLRFLEDKHDAEFGINWYAIENAIEEVVES